MVSGTLVVCITVSLFVSARPAARAETVVRAGSNTDSCEGKQISFTIFNLPLYGDVVVDVVEVVVVVVVVVVVLVL